MKNDEKTSIVDLFPQSVQDSINKAQIEAKEEAKKMIDLARATSGSKTYSTCREKNESYIIHGGKNI